jgi:hypothetical protein
MGDNTIKLLNSCVLKLLYFHWQSFSSAAFLLLELKAEGQNIPLKLANTQKDTVFIKNASPNIDPGKCYVRSRNI